MRRFAQAPGAAIGSGLARRLGVRVGDKVDLLFIDRSASRPSPFGARPRLRSYVVAMIFDVGVSAFDGSIVFLPLTEAQVDLDRPDRVTGLSVYLEHPEKLDEAKAAVAAIVRGVGRRLAIRDWRERNPALARELERIGR